MWYAAHLIMYVKFKDGVQDSYPVWENVKLIQADSPDEAMAKAAQLGGEEEGDSSGSFTWDQRPATWVFAGVRKLLEVSSVTEPYDSPVDGAEVTYTQMVVESADSLAKLVNGEPVPVLYEE